MVKVSYFSNFNNGLKRPKILLSASFLAAQFQPDNKYRMIIIVYDILSSYINNKRQGRLQLSLAYKECYKTKCQTYNLSQSRNYDLDYEYKGWIETESDPSLIESNIYLSKCFILFSSRDCLPS